ncbi:MAG TPA: 2OG-Fe(II) oxygenase [Candidatus Acidoferrum sp.]|nr:2OG-Fe(II) oxygenase [Candidatus Acidoferrum sp.]
MTAKQIFDAFSETLMQDERILSPQERELLSNILQTSRTVSSSNPETQSAVAAAIAQAVGETVAQRAFTLLGGSIVEQILAGAGISLGTEISPAPIVQGVPQPPSKAVPQPPSGPGPKGAPQPPSKAVPHHHPHHPGVPQPPSGPQGVPQPPTGPKGVPQPPSGPQGLRPERVPVQEKVLQSRLDSTSGVGVLEKPPMCQAASVVLDEFLAPHELDELIAYTLQHKEHFENSEVISPSGEPGVLDFSHRRSRVLMDLGKHQEVILERIRCVLPRVLSQLGVEEFPITHVEAQITASNDGDFFGTHSDDAQEAIASRRVTFVYFFHQEPRPFEGGELRLYDSSGDDSRGYPTRSFQPRNYETIVPEQNQIVFFPCSVSHEITRVACPSGAFADSRFTLNGWLHK